MTVKSVAGLSVAILLGLSPATVSAAAERTSVAKLLFCATGSVGLRPIPPPPGFETDFAEAVVEINSSARLEGATVTRFSLTDRDGHVTSFARLVSIEDFNELRVPGQGSFAYYLRPPHAGGTQPWNGTLLGGMTQLRIRVSLPPNSFHDFRTCSLTFGPYATEGPTDGAWAS